MRQFVACLCIGLTEMLLIACGARPGARTAPESVTEGSFGNEFRFGDLGVTVTQAKVEAFSSTSPSGRLMQHEPAFVVNIAFKNYNPNRVIDAGAQVDVATLQDDVGNNYREIQAKSDTGWTSHISGQTNKGYVQKVRSDENDARDVLVFSRPVAGASTLTLTLDASRYGGNGKVKVLIPKSAWAG